MLVCGKVKIVAVWYNIDMPASFDKCKASGGRVRTISGPNKDYGLKAGEYLHVCAIGNEVHRGYVKNKQSRKK